MKASDIRSPEVCNRVRSTHDGASNNRSLFQLRLTAVHLGIVVAAIAALNAGAQPSGSKPLFTAIENDRLVKASSAQTKLLEQMRHRPTTEWLHLVHVVPEALLGDELTITIPGGGEFKVAHTGGEGKNNRNLSWSGKVEGKETGTATFVLRNGIMTGSINSSTGLYQIESIGGGAYAVIKVDRTKLPPDEPPSSPEKAPQPPAPQPAPGMADRNANASDAPPAQIDVLIAYTPAAKAAVSDIDGTIALAVANSNAAFANSSINVHLNLAGSLQVNYSEKDSAGNYKSFDTILQDFTANTTVKLRRSLLGADVAALIMDQPAACGQADAIGATASTAYVIVQDGCAASNYSLAHEIGHLMGCRHDVQDDPTDTPYAYSHGFIHLVDAATPNDTAWRTIMAYPQPCNWCPRLEYFSDPSILYSGFPMGTAAKEDCHRVWNERGPTVAKFMSPPKMQICVNGRFTFAPCHVGTVPGIQREVCVNGRWAASGSCARLLLP